METPKRILVVEETEAYRGIIVGLLREAGYEVLEEAAPAAAQRRLAGGVPVDLLLLDAQLRGPEANGLYTWLKERPAGVRPPIVALTVGAETHRILDRLQGLQVAGLQDKRLVSDQLVYRVGGLLHPERAEQRASLRPPAGVVVNVRAEQRQFQAVVANISASGMFLASPERLLIGDLLHLQFILPGLPRLFEVPGWVVWRREQKEATAEGVGVKFDRLAAGDRVQISAYVRAELTRMGPTARAGA